MAMVSAQSPAPGATEPIRGLFSLRDVSVQAFYNARLVLACLLFGLLVGLAGALLSPPQFTAESLLLALPDAQDLLVPQQPAGPTADQVLRITQADAQILQSDPVVAAAVRQVGLDRLKDLGSPPFLHHAGPRPLAQTVEKFKKALKVSTEPTSNVIRLSFSTPDRQLSVDGLRALITAFAAQRAAAYLDPSLGPQGQALDRYAAELKRIDAAIQQLGAQHGVIDIVQDTQLANTRLDGLTLRLSQARERASAADAELGATASGIAAVPAQVLQSHESTNAIANDDGRNTVLRLRQDRAPPHRPVHRRLARRARTGRQDRRRPGPDRPQRPGPLLHRPHPAQPGAGPASTAACPT